MEPPITPDAPPADAASRDADLTASALDLGPVAAAVDALRAEVGKLVVGQHGLVDELVACLLAGGHALIEGAVPGPSPRR